MLAGACRANHLLDMLRVRCCEHHGVDLVVSQNHVKGFHPPQASLGAEAGDGRSRAGMRGGEADRTAAAHAVDEILAPPAQSHDRRPYHSLAFPISFSIARTKSCIVRVRASAKAWPASVWKFPATWNSFAPK